MSFLEIRNFSFEYALSDKKSLFEINLKIEDGDFLVLFGPSGCGKTTLLRQLKPELTPAGKSSGTVLMDGIKLSLNSTKTMTGKIGFVMQSPESQIVTDAVWHELAFGLENLGEDTLTIRRRVAEMASFFGIGSWFHKKTNELSGGQKQILNLASILVMQPKLLLLDEPTSQLDPISAREFIDMVSRLNRELGITVIMSEHRLEDVLPLANKVIMMESGRIKYQTTPELLPKILIHNGDCGALESLPAAARIFAAYKDFSKCPLTVKEGRRAILSLNKNIEKQTEFTSTFLPSCGETAIECRDVFFKYQKSSPDILNGLSFSARFGEFCCLMGENGSGKSTLLQILAGVLRPQRGKVVLNGRNIKTFSGRELYYNNIGILPQNPKSVFLRDTLCGNLNDLKIAEKLGLTELLDRHPYDLSGGEQQKAAFARILEQKPRILLLDEPSKGLDAQAKHEMAGILLELCKNGACIIASTHDMEFAANFASRCVLLFDGIIASEGNAREFFGGNNFYTTAANRIARDICPDAITCEDVIKLCGY